MKNMKDSEVHCSKRKMIENVGPMLKQGGYLVTKDMDKSELLSAYLQWRSIRLGNIEWYWTHRRLFHLTDAHTC